MPLGFSLFAPAQVQRNKNKMVEQNSFIFVESGLIEIGMWNVPFSLGLGSGDQRAIVYIIS